MAKERPILIIDALTEVDMSATATSPLTGYGATGQFLIAKQSTDRAANTVVNCTSHADRPRGIIQNNPPAGQAVALLVSGMSKVMAGGTLTPGDSFGTDNAGRGVRKNETSTGADYKDFVMGEVIEGATVGQLATVLLTGVYRI